MTRGGRSSRAATARVSAIPVLLVGVSVSACADTGTPAASTAAGGSVTEQDGHDHDHGGEHDHGEDHGHEDGHDHGEGHDHDHGDHSHETAATTGPPRPADPDVECGTTVLPNGQQITRYCDEGEATFTVAEDDKETTVEGGTCEDRGALFLAHFGTNYSDDVTARGDYLGLALEEMPETSGPAPIYALELTIDGYHQTVAEATVNVSWEDRTLNLDVVGELPDGRSLEITANCHVHDA